MKTKVEDVASLLQTMHNEARLIIEKKGGQTLNLWVPIKIFLKNDALMVSEGSECTLFTQRSPIDQAIILDNLISIKNKTK